MEDGMFIYITPEVAEILLKYMNDADRDGWAMDSLTEEEQRILKGFIITIEEIARE